MCTFSPGLRGLTPMRSARCAVENLPKPVNVTESPALRGSSIVSSTASTASAAAASTARPLGHTINELRLRHCAHSPRCRRWYLLRFGSGQPTRRVGCSQRCGFAVSSGARQLARPKEGHEADADRRERLRCRPPRGRRHRPPSGTRGPAARSASTAGRGAPPDVTTSSTRQTSSPGLEDALEPIGAVPFARLADDQERQPGLERGGRREGHRAELRPGEPDGRGLLGPTAARDALAERAEQVGSGLEPVLVEVVASSGARTAGRSRLRDRRAPGSAGRAQRRAPSGARQSARRR